jgi:hypothetical protein
VVIDYSAIPQGFDTKRIVQGEFVLCPTCGQALVQTSEEYLGCVDLDHTGLIRHRGKVDHSWALHKLWRWCRTMPMHHRFCKGVFLDDEHRAWRMLDGQVKLVGDSYSIPWIEDKRVRAAMCMFRGLLGPRFFVPITVKGLKRERHVARDGIAGEPALSDERPT